MSIDRTNLVASPAVLLDETVNVSLPVEFGQLGGELAADEQVLDTTGPLPLLLAGTDSVHQERCAQVKVRPAKAHCPRIVEAMLGVPWALEADKLAAVAEFIAIRAVMAEPISPQAVAFAVRGQQGGARVHDSVAVVPIMGVLGHRMNMLGAISGGTSTEQLGHDIDTLANDPGISAIVLDIDSPGGAVAGTPELGARIVAAKERKPVIAVANARAGSAAYWLASQASEVVVTPSGEVGSIGVVGMHRDMSRAMEQEGIATTLISAGKYKTEGNPFGPLSQEARDAFQAQVDDAYGAFVNAVASGRKVEPQAVRDGFGQGRMVGAKQAVRLGMADRVDTLQATVQRMLSARARATALRRAAALFEIKKRA